MHAPDASPSGRSLELQLQSILPRRHPLYDVGRDKYADLEANFAVGGERFIASILKHGATTSKVARAVTPGSTSRRHRLSFRRLLLAPRRVLSASSATLLLVATWLQRMRAGLWTIRSLTTAVAFFVG
eukprot:6204952-Pleurochrysis_carterae.AAC.10